MKPRDITYCTNDKCTRNCERKLNFYDFTGHVYSRSNFFESPNQTEENCEFYMPNGYISYDKWGDFEFRPPTYLDGHFEPKEFDLVKWCDQDPIEVIDIKTGKKKISTRYCFSIGSLKWDEHEKSFEFESVGLRFLEQFVEGLDKFILDFAHKMEKELTNET